MDREGIEPSSRCRCFKYHTELGIEPKYSPFTTLILGGPNDQLRSMPVNVSAGRSFSYRRPIIGVRYGDRTRILKLFHRYYQSYRVDLCRLMWPSVLSIFRRNAHKLGRQCRIRTFELAVAVTIPSWESNPNTPIYDPNSWWAIEDSNLATSPCEEDRISNHSKAYILVGADGFEPPCC